MKICNKSKLKTISSNDD